MHRKMEDTADERRTIMEEIGSWEIATVDRWHGNGK
jgi:hypothetical protein